MNALADAQTFEQFEAAARAQGFDEVLEKVWSPDLVLAQHQHPFDVSARVMAGEVWLTCAGEVRHLVAGMGFELDRNAPHAERYGAAGATFWVARRHASDPAPSMG